jgi:hypothetical protein
VGLSHAPKGRVGLFVGWLYYAFKAHRCKGPITGQIEKRLSVFLCLGLGRPTQTFLRVLFILADCGHWRSFLCAGARQPLSNRNQKPLALSNLKGLLGAITSRIPWLSCRSCRPHAPFAELVRLSPLSLADDMHEEHRRRVLSE